MKTVSFLDPRDKSIKTFALDQNTHKKAHQTQEVNIKVPCDFFVQSDLKRKIQDGRRTSR